METNVSASERTPRIAIGLAAGVAAALTSNLLLKGFLLSSATAMLATAATGYCPINALLEGQNASAPEWRTLKTYRVEA